MSVAKAVKLKAKDSIGKVIRSKKNEQSGELDEEGAAGISEAAVNTNVKLQDLEKKPHMPKQEKRRASITNMLLETDVDLLEVFPDPQS